MSNQVVLDKVESWLISQRDSEAAVSLFTAMNRYADLAYGNEKSDLTLEDSVAVQNIFARVFSDESLVVSTEEEEDYWDQSEAYSDDY